MAYTFVIYAIFIVMVPQIQIYFFSGNVWAPSNVNIFTGMMNASMQAFTFFEELLPIQTSRLVK